MAYFIASVAAGCLTAFVLVGVVYYIYFGRKTKISKFSKVHSLTRGYVVFKTKRRLSARELEFISEKGDENNMPKGTKFVRIIPSQLSERMKEIVESEALSGRSRSSKK